MSTTTLYHRINQSIRYLLEHIDPTGKYSLWYDTVHITRPKGVGIVIESVIGTQDESFDAEILVEENIPLWRREMDEWLDDPKKIEPYVKFNLILTPEEILQIKSELAQLGHIIASITSSTIKIVKLNTSK